MFQDFAKEAFSSLPIAVLGHQNVQNIAILINCWPEVDLPALNPHEQFINVPNIAQPTLLPSDRLGVLRLWHRFAVSFFGKVLEGMITREAPATSGRGAILMVVKNVTWTRCSTNSHGGSYAPQIDSNWKVT